MLGFRSKTPYKIIIALIYYSLCFLGFNYGVNIGVATLLIFITTPVAICSIYDTVRTKNLNLLYTLPVWIIALGIGFMLYASEVADTKTVTTDKAVVTEDVSLVSESETYSVSNDDKLVYMTRSGSKYHNSDCRTLIGKETVSLRISNAETDGKSPCDICKPKS